MPDKCVDEPPPSDAEDLPPSTDNDQWALDNYIQQGYQALVESQKSKGATEKVSYCIYIMVSKLTMQSS
jgi:hypothetical protein